LSLWESGEKVIKSLFIHHEGTKVLPWFFLRDLRAFVVKTTNMGAVK